MKGTVRDRVETLELGLNLCMLRQNFLVFK
jgi:hypothetical protein